MASTSTSDSDSSFTFPKNFPINTAACKEMFSTDLSLKMEGKSLNLVMEQPVDFDSLEKNHFDVLKFFSNHKGSFRYMNLLNGPIYPTLVKDFWIRSKVKTVEDYDKELDARREEKAGNEVKTPQELGLRIVEETEVHSVVCGFEVILTASNLAKVLSIPNEGFYYTCSHNEAKKSVFLKTISRQCYDKRKSCESNRIGDLKPTQRVLAKIILNSIFPGSENSDQLSWDHKHFVYFLTRKYDINWAKYIFDHLCKAVINTQNQAKTNMPVIYPRLLSEIFYQCGVIDIIKAAGHDCLVREIRASTISVHTLSHMNLVSEHEVKTSDPLVPQSHSEPSMVKKWNIDIPTVSSGIVNQYIQLLDNLGEEFEIEKEELKKKRRRPDEAANEGRHSDSRGHREGSS
ncbi:hypothetical protein L195_g013665 [Trifolium pratense]|uniref:Uncharacterized protein n=1 Tax=Trifolium pratense TaxID=57577 RepID=A0A2K3PNU8_TRIPR|nr:hypothetical protein L195_g013665 [Trifolium pratense]